MTRTQQSTKISFQWPDIEQFDHWKKIIITMDWHILKLKTKTEKP